MGVELLRVHPQLVAVLARRRGTPSRRERLAQARDVDLERSSPAVAGGCSPQSSSISRSALTVSFAWSSSSASSGPPLAAAERDRLGPRREPQAGQGFESPCESTGPGDATYRSRLLPHSRRAVTAPAHHDLRCRQEHQPGGSHGTAVPHPAPRSRSSFSLQAGQLRCSPSRWPRSSRSAPPS